MKINIFEDDLQLSTFAANLIVEVIQHKPNALICFASGNSPRLTCELFVQQVKDKNINISQCSFIGFDEWVGVTPEIKGSCHFDFLNRLVNPLALQPYQYHLYDGMAENLELECAIMDEWIDERGRIDIMIVGIGMNGHIGFNEPDVDIDLRSHVIELADSTVVGGRKYFDHDVTLKKGITLGFGYLIHSIKVLLLANGVNKSSVIQQAVEGALTTSFPASIMQIHPEGYIIVDKEAGSLLKIKASSLE